MYLQDDIIITEVGRGEQKPIALRHTIANEEDVSEEKRAITIIRQVARAVYRDSCKSRPFSGIPTIQRTDKFDTDSFQNFHHATHHINQNIKALSKYY